MSFDDRYQFADVMHRRYISQALAQYYDVAEKRVTQIDADASDQALALDSDGGVDCMVATSNGPVFIAERCRTRREYYGRLTDPDFSLRARSADGSDAELDRLLGAFRTRRNLPKLYAFGIGKKSTKSACKRSGLRALVFIDTVALMQQIDADALPYEEHRSDSGEVSRYYSLDDLRAADVIVDEAWADCLNSLFDDQRSLDPDFPRSNPRGSGKTVRLGDFA